ncbi:Rhodanese-like protein [Desulfovibrio sp. X2]|uniref:rhodanese-like domain-containing protein n=1 Tax=Desulfovibrio sp. X2 TaxID=941449 RepID=UPI0003587068|nr:rhodanese-like domain-containing protein [Desulfovibrio sp. X2]EPR43076.1 Rhodanese-like protein [Desulfovibrio sp. X2]
MTNPKRLALLLALCLALGLALASTALAGNKFEDEVTAEKYAVLGANLAMQAMQGDYKLVDAATLKSWIDEKKDMVIVDTMPYEASYLKAHVPGAEQFLFPVPTMTKWDAKETDGKSEADFEKLLGPDKAKTIVIYCGFVKCTRSHNGAMWARKLGYTNVYRFPGGIYAWMGADYPVAK